MKTAGLVVTILLSLSAVSQELDSIPFGKVKMQAGSYELHHRNLRELQLITGQAIPYAELPRTGKENFSEAVWTLLTGINSSTLIESAWIYPNALQLTGAGSIHLPLIVHGTYEKSRERVRTSEGNTIETTEQVILQLEKGAWGWIIDVEDTLGNYLVTKRPEGPAGSAWNTYFGKDLGWLKEKTRKYGALESPTDFMIEGDINGKSFQVMYSGQYYRAVVIQNDAAVATWQDTPYAVMLTKKYRIYPYLLMPASASDEEFNELVTVLGLAHTISRNMLGI